MLFGDGGRDMLNGGAGADELHGGAGNDGFFGGGGDDRLPATAALTPSTVTEVMIASTAARS